MTTTAESSEPGHRLGSAQSLPAIHVSGTHYQVAYQVGRTFKHQIQTYCEQSETLNNLLLPYYRSPEGREVCDEYRDAMKEVYPQYEDEIRGTADASETDYHKLLLLHFSAELLGILGCQGSTTGCSDLMLNYVDSNGKQHSLMAHNEDGDWLIASNAYLIHAHITPDRQLYPHLPVERFVSYTYPARLAGNCMSANHHGIIWSMNILFPKKVLRRKTGTYTMIRAMAAATSLEHAQKIVSDDPLGCGYGLSLNIAQHHPNPAEIVMMNIEIGPGTNEAGVPVHHVTTLPLSADLRHGFAYHFNMYRHMTHVDHHEDSSSIHREQAVLTSGADGIKSLASVLAVLSNQDDTKFPVYRNGKPPDYMATLATGVFDVLDGTFSIYVDNPSGTDPVVVLPVTSVPNSWPPAKTL